MRVALLAFLHESNTFLVQKTTYADIESNSITVDDAMIERWTGVKHEIGGMIEGCRQQGIEIAGGMAALATPSGVIEAAAFSRVVDELLASLVRCDVVDGVLMALHGATVSEEYPDADGEILQRVRAIVGSQIPVISTLDLHANVSETMVRESNALIAYRTNPHVDQYERGVEAALLMSRTLDGDVAPVQALAAPPLIIPISSQYTSQEPAYGLYAAMDKVVQRYDLLSASTCMGFYYADVKEMGATFLAVADGSKNTAQRAANEMAMEAWAKREDFLSDLPDAATAVGEALRSEKAPVVLLDIGDNVGGGSAGDSTIMLAELMAQGAKRFLIVLHDPEAARMCAEAGVRRRVALHVGGKKDNLHGAPIWIEGDVQTLSDGIFVETEVRHGGWSRMDQGVTAVVRDDAENLIVLTSLRVPPFSLEQIRSLGIHPERMKVLVVKGVVAPRAAYAPIAREIVAVDTQGTTANDPARFVYSNRRRPIFPLERETRYGDGA